MEFRPHKYQEYAREFIIGHPVCALILDMGLGKTVITLTALWELALDYFEVGKVLVIAPFRVARDTWKEELEKWDHLKGLSVSVVVGSEKERLDALEKKASVYVINRENVVWLCEKHHWDFDMIVIDELSSFKSYQAKRFKALRRYRPKAIRVVGLTGTPGNLMDLWAEIGILDMGQRLGRYIGAYRDRFFLPDKRNRNIIYSYKPRDGAEEAIYNLISDICISMKAEDYLSMPECLYHRVEVRMDEKEEKLYRQMEKDMLLPFEDGDVDAVNAAALSGKLLQMANGAVYDENHKVRHIHDKKLDALEGKDTGGEREEIDTSKLSLQELYNSMLELDSDWVELYRKQIFSMKKTVAKIIKFELTVDFVVELNIRMAMGMNFNYTNAKRYVFGVYLFKHRTTTRTYNLVNEQYNLRLYAMGAVGLRAGVEIWPSVSLISRKVATVGIVAKLGAYLKGYGYVLYALHYEAGKPKTSNASGALYVEVGMFMDISANLSAFKGKVSWTPEIYTDETPLWSAGSTHAITAFKMENADGEEDTPTVYLKNGGLDVVLPQSVQALTGFDLTTGNDRTETYDWNKFDISFDDPRFSAYHTGVYGGNYSQQHIKLALDNWQTCDEPEIDCVMTLTYKGSDLSFSTTPVQLKVKVHWDRLRDGYPIHELSSTGGYIGWEQRKFDEALNLKTPARTGYDFTGWTYYLLKNESNIFSYDKEHPYTGTTMPESALVAVATFEPKTNIPYTLNFYLQNEDLSLIHI